MKRQRLPRALTKSVNMRRALTVRADLGVNLEGVSIAELEGIIANNLRIGTAGGPMKWSKRAKGPTDLFGTETVTACCGRALDMLFKCETCGAVVCYCFGAADEMPGSCDKCWSKQNRKAS